MSATDSPTATRLLDNYIGGAWTPSTSSETLDVTNPATGETLARVPLSSAADLDAAVKAARAAGVNPGYRLARDYPEFADGLLVAITERRTRADIDKLAEVLAGVRQEVPA